MASLDLSGASALPRVYNETLSGTNGNVRLVTLPAKLGDFRVTLVARTQVAKVIDGSTVPAEDAAIGSVAYSTIPVAGMVMDFYATDHRGTNPIIGLASATNSQVVEIRIDRLGRA